MNEDLKIAQAATLEDIETIAAKAGIAKEYLEPYGRDKAKVDTKIFASLKDKPDGKLILVTAITPTKAGEGKSNNHWSCRWTEQDWQESHGCPA